MTSKISCGLICNIQNDSAEIQQWLNRSAAYDATSHEYELLPVEEENWELGVVLARLFHKAKMFFPELKRFVEAEMLTVYLDVCIVHYDRYPAMIIEGDVMKQIRELKADIAIDMY